jgi:hypothetical protein
MSPRWERPRRSRAGALSDRRTQVLGLLAAAATAAVVTVTVAMAVLLGSATLSATT